MDETPAETPAPKSFFENGALWWLIFFDTAWSVPEVVAFFAEIILAPLCFFGSAIPIFLIQRRSGDTFFRAGLKAVFLGVLAALPFPVAGTGFGIAFLGLAKLNSPR